MSLALATIMLAAVSFEECDLPGIRVGEVNPLTGKAQTGFRHVDINGDGFTDLLLPDGVINGKPGGSFESEVGPFPWSNRTCFCDIWKGRMYLRFDSELKVVRWREGAWRTVLRQELEWPAGVHYQGASIHASDQVKNGPHLQRFLHDLDGDDIPELLIPALRGIVVYGREEGRYAECGCLDVLPDATVRAVQNRPLWPPNERRLGLPVREMSCRYSIKDNTVTVIEKQDSRDTFTRYRITMFPIVRNNGYRIDPARVETTLSEPIPNCAEPCRLNGDGIVDFAGGDWELSRACAFPTPVYETYVTCDYGQSYRILRSRSFRPNASFVDYDSDGDMDMLIEAATLFDGGIRETISRFMTARKIDHEIHVYFQNTRRRFSRTPDISARFAIHLEKAPWRGASQFQRYVSGDALSLIGDFNNDGYRDAVVRERPDRLSVYEGTATGFGGRPVAHLDIDPDWEFSVTDVDADGRSDIVAQWYEKHGDAWRTNARVFLSREKR